MNLTNYTASDERDRLSGVLTARGSNKGISTGFGFLFGLPFVGMGMFIALVGLKIVHVNPKSVHAPYPVIFIAGFVFYLAGMWVWGMAAAQYKENCRRARVKSEHPNNPALADYPWDMKGFTAPRWSSAFKQIAMACAMALFLSMFNWWAWFGPGDLFVRSIVSLFDAILLGLWVYAFVVIGRAIKFGKSRIEYTTFPYHTGDKVVLRWLTPTGIGRADSGTFTLRCVQQWYEMSGSGDNRSKQVVQEVQWSAEWSLAAPEEISPGKVVELRFDVPSSALPTDMSALKPIYWELAISLKERGLDFKQTYLVPIYKHADPIPASSPAIR